ncbi:hypothetical protein [Variovorax sp. YR266]|uniref:hypothetical protein n=1 Tax=Variovorax sp. YR266 TaxID=1884386 RepID=UPI00115FDB97|nr:hypothetical protein [Variovorax sp. YR266]
MTWLTIRWHIPDTFAKNCAFKAQLSCWPINRRVQRSRRWCALRSEIKEEAEGRGTFAKRSTPSA